MLVTLLGSEFHKEIVLNKECKSVCVRKRLKVGIRTSSTLAWYKMEKEKVIRLCTILNMVLSLCSARLERRD